MLENTETRLAVHEAICAERYKNREKNELDAIASPNITVEEAWKLMETAPLTKDY
jgi:hypothetical protein